MFAFVFFAVTFAVSWIGFGGARRFVRDRLRYVDAAMSPGAPILAGVVATLVATLVAAPIVWLLPIVTGLTAVFFGVSVALGVRAGASDVKRGYLISSGQ